MNFTIYKNTVNVSVTPSDSFNVLQYLPIEEKNDLIAVALQRSDENGFYNPVKLKMYFELNTFYLYTDFAFTDEERINEIETYNILKSNGIIDAAINAIPATEYAELTKLFDTYLAKKEKYRGSIAGVLNGFIENLAPNAENAASIINNFNPEMFQQVIKFAEAANGGRPIQ